MTRRLSHVHHWRLLVTPPHNLLYVIYHLYLHVAYIGITTMALVGRLRKHMTDTLSNQDCSSLHSKMCVTDLSHWGILPLQLVDDDWLASIRERHWWFTYRKYAINDIAPGICADGTGRNTGWLNQKVLALLQGIRDARAIDDFGRVKFLQGQLRELAGELSIPLHTLGQIVVPNCTDDQKTLLHSVIRRMISSSPLTAWEKQALHKSVRVVRSTPYTVQRLIQKPAKQFDASPSRPKCACHRIAHLATHMPDGHCAVIPVQFSLPSGTRVRPKDPLPIPGHEARAAAIKCLQAFGKQVHSTVADVPQLIPAHHFAEPGRDLQFVREQVLTLSQSLYIRIVDKGVGQVWGFCKWWVWGVLESFVRAEGYVTSSASPSDVKSKILKLVEQNGWDGNPQGMLCTMYLLGKAKSLTKAQWLWRGIYAIPRPLINKKSLRIAARTMTRFLRYITEEVAGNFVVHRVTDVSAWFTFLDSIGARYITEIDCKDQFNKIQPT
jgi:hypothetical protein